MVKDNQRPDDLVRVRLTMQRFPKLVVLGKAGLDRIRPEETVNVRLIAATITGVPADGLTEELLHFRYERVGFWQIDSIKGVVRGLETPCQRTGVVALGRRDLLVLDL